MELRKYQREAIDAIYNYFQNNSGNPLVVMPTGTGKSVVLAGFLRESLHSWPDTRVVVLTHVKELIQQNFNAMIAAWPDAPAGIYSAGLNRRQIDTQIIFAGIQSIYKKAYEIQRCDLILIDEAHLLSQSDAGMYRRFLSDLTTINPTLKVVGLTATPYRLDQGMLTTGDNTLFTDIAYDVDILDMVEQGYLVPLVPLATRTKLDVSNVHVRGGEFIASELEAAVDTEELNLGAVNEIIMHGADRGSWLVFCSGVSHAEHVCEKIRNHGISCEVITGDTPSMVRDRILRDFKSGKIRCLTNMNVLTTGFDAPGLDLIAMLRPTKSISLYVQMLGRGTRLANGKEDCLVLDFAGNTKRHGPVDEVMKRVKQPGKGGGIAPTKECPECNMILATKVAVCPNCGHQFPPPKPNVSDVSDTSALLSTQVKDEWLKVSGVNYSIHTKTGKPPSLLVTYQTGMSRHREWICFEHPGYAREKAVKWWHRRTQNEPIPSTVKDALSLSNKLPAPSKILVRPNGKYSDITGYIF